jgi:hypothetical protein
MLKKKPQGAAGCPPMRIPEHRLWIDEGENTISLGCWNCPERKSGICGGLSIAAGLMNCLDFCCGAPASCERPCRNHPDYPLRVREVGTFALESTPRGPVLDSPHLPPVVTVLFHGKRREKPISPRAVALPLYAMVHRRDGRLRFASHEDLCEAFGIVPGTPIILTGTDQDASLERWWEYEDKRRAIVRDLAALGVVMSTTPNFSLILNGPRHIDFHAMKRIALCHAEFLDGGIPTALHVNGRSATDFRRWGAFVRERPEVTHLAYEFTTGTGRAGRRDHHVAWLAGVAADARRPLDLLVRGGIDLLPQLTPVFRQVTVLETVSFMKTMKRQQAARRPGRSPGWRSAPTAVGAPVDALFAHNRAAVRQWIEDRLVPPSVGERITAAAG